MASAWITRRGTKNGAARYRVEFRVGGRETATRYAGSFTTKREADERKRWVSGELAARRVPDLRPAEPETVVTLRTIAERWKASRVDVAEGTMQTYRVALGRPAPRLGDTPVEAIDAQTVADLVAELHADGLKKQTIRKTVSASGDGARPRGRRAEPRTRPADGEAAQGRASASATADRRPHRGCRAPAAVALPAADARARRDRDACRRTRGAHVGRPGRAARRWRVATSKTGRPRWVTPPPLLLDRVLELCARDDRHADRRVFEQVTGDRLRTALTRACTAAGVPAFSPHDLRHRRVT